VRIREKFIGPGTSAQVTLDGAEPVRVHTFCGLAPGPRFFVVAGLHGDEGLGVMIAEELAATLDPRELHGVAFVVPRAAPSAVRTKERNIPGCADLNRCFPGRRDGDAAWHVAHQIFREIASKCDFGLDLHDSGGACVNVPHARGDLNNHYVRRMCESFGATLILDGQGPARSLRRVATDHGVPTFAFEAGGVGRGEKAIILEGVRGAIGVMSNLRMLAEEIPWRGPPTVVRDARWVACQRGGKLESCAQPGEHVRAGEVVARVNGVALHSPRAGLVLTARHARDVEPESPVCEIAVVVEQPSARANTFEE
jgi:hypothetical protein